MTSHLELPDTASIREFMETFNQTVRTEPTADVTDKERLLRGALVIEEALELLKALGLNFAIGKNSVPQEITDPKDFALAINPDVEIDLVETADAVSDIIVVTKGTALTFGIPVDNLTIDEVMPSNMSKAGPDKKPIYDPVTNKVLKAEGWYAPNIPAFLNEYGWKATESTSTATEN